MTDSLIKLDFKARGYLRFANADAKAWVLPVRNMAMALLLYQPSGLKGRVLKCLLPYVHALPVVRALLGARLCSLSLGGGLSSVLTAVLGTADFDCSVFEGTPSVHQKVTLQLFEASRVLAYAKISSNPEVIALFRHEQAVLQRLAEAGCESVPRCLFCGEVDDGHWLFVQSTVKSRASVAVHAWGAAHWAFLGDLRCRTSQLILFEESDFAQALSLLDCYCPQLPAEDAALLAACVAEQRVLYAGREVEFCAYHADFTPWNMLMEAGELFVFDFEYAGMSYPPYLDYFHFYTQTAIFEKHWSAEDLLRDFPQRVGDLSSYMDDVPKAYKAYLLSVMSQYLHREKGVMSEALMEKLQFWLSLLRGL